MSTPRQNGSLYTILFESAPLETRDHPSHCTRLGPACLNDKLHQEGRFVRDRRWQGVRQWLCPVRVRETEIQDAANRARRCRDQEFCLSRTPPRDSRETVCRYHHERPSRKSRFVAARIDPSPVNSVFFNDKRRPRRLNQGGDKPAHSLSTVAGSRRLYSQKLFTSDSPATHRGEIEMFEVKASVLWPNCQRRSPRVKTP